jgi:hypothetical protein
MGRLLGWIPISIQLDRKMVLRTQSRVPKVEREENKKFFYFFNKNV